MKNVAVITAKGIGDGLIYLTLSHNLTRCGFNVTTFSSALTGLRSWFPTETIVPHPAPTQDFLASFDRIFIADHTPFSHLQDSKITHFPERHFDPKKTIVENLRHYCETTLQLPFHAAENGIQPPSHLTFRKYANRVILHPMSSEAKKNWKKSKFLKLATRLQNEGLDPLFCMSSDEQKQWNEDIERNPRLFPHFPSLTELAACLFESGWLIGNDSGLGHLASCLQIPTCSLFAKKRYAELWRPGFGENIVVAPYSLPLGGRLRQTTWTTFLTVGRVTKAFKKNRER